MTKGSIVDSPQPFFLPTPHSEEEMGSLSNMDAAAGFNPNQVNIALSGLPAETEPFQGVAGMQPRACNELDMVLDNCFIETPATVAPATVAPATVAPSNAWSGNAMGSCIPHDGNNNATLKLEDVEAPHSSTGLQTRSATAQAAKPPPPALPVRNKRATNTNANTNANSGSVQPAQEAQSGQPARTGQAGRPGQTQTAGQRKKRPARNRAYTSPEDAEKREKFLERNRQAAYKCRKRRKEELIELQTLHVTLQKNKEDLEEELRNVRSSLSDLVSLAMSHGGCQDQSLANWLRDYQVTEQARLMRQQQEQQQQVAQDANQAVGQEANSGLPMYAPAGGETNNNHPGMHGATAIPHMQQQQAQQAHQAHQAQHVQQIQHGHQVHQAHQVLQPHPQQVQQPMTPVPSAVMMPMPPTMFTHASFAMSTATPAGPVPETYFAMSPHTAAPSPPALMRSHRRQGSSHSSASTLASSDSSAYAARPASNYTSTSSVSSVTGTPNMADFTQFTDVKQYLQGDEEHESMFSNFYVVESPPFAP